MSENRSQSKILLNSQRRPLHLKLEFFCERSETLVLTEVDLSVD